MVSVTRKEIKISNLEILSVAIVYFVLGFYVHKTMMDEDEVEED